MGRMGPAFLAYANFAAYTEWNNSLIYSTTAGYLATRIAGAPPMQRPSSPVAQLPFNELRELQQLLVRAGFNVGKVDGIMGQLSRTAVKTMQIKYGLPADSWPTAELLARMRGTAAPRHRAQPRAARAVGGALTARTIDQAHSAIVFCRSPTSSHTLPRARSYSTARKEHHMSFHDAAVPAYLQILGSLTGILTKAEAHCTAKKIQPDVLLGARLYPDMLPLSKQIQLACDFAAKGCARLTDSEVPSMPDTEKTFEELKQRLAKTIDYVKAFKPAQFDGADARDVTFPVGPDRSITMKGQQFLTRLLVAELLLPRHHRPRHPAAQRRGNRQAGFSRGELSPLPVIPGQPAGLNPESRCIPRCAIAHLRFALRAPPE